MHDAQAQMSLEGIEVSITVQQHKTVHQAARGDEGIDHPADGYPERSQTAVVPGCLDGQLRAADDDLFESPQQAPGFVEASIIREALQDFGEDQVADEKRLEAQVPIQPFRLRSRLVTECYAGRLKGELFNPKLSCMPSFDEPPFPPDHETRLQAHDHTALRLWLRLLTCTSLIEGSVRQILRTDFDSTLPRFDLLAQLDRHPQGLRMSELSQRLMVTGGNITALADQLEAEGLLHREPVSNDRRSIRLKLSTAGRKRFAEMAAGHERWVVSLFERLSQDEQRQLLALLAKLKPGLVEGKRRAEEQRATKGRSRSAGASRNVA